MFLKTPARFVLSLAATALLTGCVTFGINEAEVKQGEKAVIVADIYRVISALPGVVEKRAFPEKYRFERIDGKGSIFSGITEVEHSAPTAIEPGTYGIYSIGAYGSSSDPYIATFTAKPGDVLYLGSYEVQLNEDTGKTGSLPGLTYKLTERTDLADAKKELAKEAPQLVSLLRHQPLKLAPAMQ